MLEADDFVFKKTNKLKEIKSKIFASIEDIFPIVDDDNKLVGTFSKVDVEKESPVQLILVDHNELGQAVDGADSVPIIEVLDHHRLDMAPTLAPVTVYNDIVGSTCTLVAEKFRISGMKLSGNIAGVLLGGIITDTLLLRSPTTTTRDVEALRWLESIAKVKANKLADDLFNMGSTIARVNLSDVFESDRKNFSTSKFKFSISQIEETSFDKFNSKFNRIKEQAEKIFRAEKLDMISLLVTNVIHETSVLLVVGNPRLLNALPYRKIKDNLYDLPGVLSRKKQLLPQLIKALDKII
jgi:manganese-dependent inorganic pyrophosphatase